MKKNLLRRCFSIVLAVIFAVSFFAGCSGTYPPPNGGQPQPGDTALQNGGTSGSQSGEKKTIGILLQLTMVARWNNADIPAIQARAAELGYEVFLQSAEGDSDMQVKQAETMLIKGVDCIILQPVNFKAGSGIVDMANEEGVPVVVYNDSIEDTTVAAFCGRNAKEVGMLSAQKMVEKYPSGNYIICGGDEAHAAARDMVAGFKEVLAQHPDITIVSDLFNTDWAAENSLKQVEGALLANKDDIAAILCCNDSLAMGALQALEANGLVGKVGVSGMDAESSALKSIVAGDMFFTSFTEYGAMAKDAIDFANALINGQELPEHIEFDAGKGGMIPWRPTEMVFIDKDNVEDFIDSHDWWVTREEVFG